MTIMDAGFEKALGRRISALRSLRFSQRSLAAELGVSRNAVIAWEKGESVPDTVNLVQIADLFGVSLDELTGRTPMPEVLEEDALARSRAIQKTLQGQEQVLSAHHTAFERLLEVLLTLKVLPALERDRLRRTLNNEK